MKGAIMVSNHKGDKRGSGVGGVLGVALASMALAAGCASEAVPSASVSENASARSAAFIGPAHPRDILTPSGRSRMGELEAVFSRPRDPGVDVIAIRPRDVGLVKVKQNGEVPLRALAPAGTSVIFRTTDGGKLVGGSIIVEVKADQAGTATAVFRATEDARGFVDVVAMSPEMSGSATFTVEIER